MITAPRSLSAQARAAVARPMAQSPLEAALGVTCHAARGRPPPRKCRQEPRTCWIVDQRSSWMIIRKRAPGRASLGFLCRSVTRRHGQPHYVGEGPGVVIGNLPDQLCDLGSEHRLAGDDLGERGQRSLMISGGNALENEPVPETPGEARPHPSTRNRIRILLSRHRIVEGTVQVTQRNVDSHPGHGKFRLAGFGHTR